MSQYKPEARRKQLIARKTETELLVYDVERHRAHSLDARLATLWRLCDGTRGVAELARRLSRDEGVTVDEPLVWIALERLHAARLLSAPPPRAPSSGSSRREWLRNATALGLALATITVPRLAEALTSITDAACAARPSASCGNIPCRDNPGNVCKLIVGIRRCSCTQN